MYAWYAIFPCPGCLAWLKPNRKYAVLTAIGAVLILASILVMWLVDGPGSIWAGAAMLILSAIVFVYAHRTIVPKLVPEAERPFEFDE